MTRLAFPLGLILQIWLSGQSIAIAAEAATPSWRAPLESMIQTRERPLFTRARRPPPVAPTPESDLAPGLDQLRVSLLGVLLGPEGSGVAVLRDEDSKVLRQTQVGDTLNHWTLVELRRRAAVFQRNGDTLVIEMPKPEPRPADGGVSISLEPPVDEMPPQPDAPPPQ